MTAFLFMALVAGISNVSSASTAQPVALCRYEMIEIQYLPSSNPGELIQRATADFGIPGAEKEVISETTVQVTYNSAGQEKGFSFVDPQMNPHFTVHVKNGAVEMPGGIMDCQILY